MSLDPILHKFVRDIVHARIRDADDGVSGGYGDRYEQVLRQVADSGIPGAVGQVESDAASLYEAIPADATDDDIHRALLSYE